MATTALYSVSSNEVVKINPKGQLFSDRDTAFWGVLTDPALPDGNEVRDTSGFLMGPLRVLGLSKIAVPGTNTVRNATQAEIDGFEASQMDIDSQQEANRAKELLNSHPQFRRVLVAMADILKDEINILRAQHGLPARTLAQFKTAMLNRISKDD